MSVNVPLIALVLFALVCVLIGGRRKVAPAIIGISVCLVLAYFALAIMAPVQLAALLAALAGL